MLNDAWENKYDKAILFSGDGDFASLLKYVKNKNKKVEVISFDKLASRNLLNEADKFSLINKKIANKFFWREKQKKKKKSHRDYASSKNHIEGRKIKIIVK